MTRFEQLARAISNLAANADVQNAYLESILAPISGCNDGQGYGNDELAMEFEGIFLAASDMVFCEELSDVQLEALKPLDEMLDKLSGKENTDFWKRDSLWNDPRWENVRQLAKQAKGALAKP